MEKDIAVLLTCFNRKKKTLASLEKLQEAILPNDINKLDVFLVDDGSTDGTSEAIKKTYPKVNVIKGNGNLFWNQGMRLAWKTASSKKDYDFYLWLNDDVALKKLALNELYNCYKEGLNKDGTPCLITGAFQNSKTDSTFSYGGRSATEPVIPNGKLQPCKYINGNAVLVPKEIFNVLGNLAKEYTHGIGDFDYGLRSLQNSFNNYTTKIYIGYCEVNGLPNWSNPEIPLKKRLKLFRSPRGLNFSEYILFRKKFWGNKWIIYAIKAYLKVLFPKFYARIKN